MRFWFKALALLALMLMPFEAFSQRTALTSDLTINIPTARTTGAGTFTDPYNVQPDIDWLYNTVDMAGFNVTIQMGYGVGEARKWHKSMRFSGRVPGQAGLQIPLLNAPNLPPFIVGKKGRLTLRGNPADPTGSFIFPDATEGMALSISDAVSLNIEGIAMDSSRTQQDCMLVFNNSYVNMANIVFGNCGPPTNLFANQMSLAFGAYVWISGLVEVRGSSASFATVGNNSALYWNNNGDPGLTIPFVITNGITFRDAFLQADNGIIYAIAVAFSGQPNARKFRVLRYGVIETNTGNPNYLPGNQPGDAPLGNAYYH